MRSEARAVEEVIGMELDSYASSLVVEVPVADHREPRELWEITVS